MRTAVPNSNANVDLNADCAADLMLVALPPDAPVDVVDCAAPTQCELLVWLQHVCRSSDCDPVAEKWARAPDLNETLPAGAGQVSLADMDGDGLTDLVFTSAERSATRLHVWYAVVGERPPYCGASLPRELCAVGGSLSFDKYNFTIEDGWALASAGVWANATRPPTLSIADFSLDGFPEVLLPLRAPAHLPETANCGAGRACVLLLHNDDALRCQAEAGEVMSLRLYSGAEDAAATGVYRLVPLLADATGALFVDLYEDGVWDVLGTYPNGTLSAWRQVCRPTTVVYSRSLSFDSRCSRDVGRYRRST